MKEEEKNEMKLTIGKYLKKRKKYFDDVNEIREKEMNGEVYPWDADSEIKELDIDLNSSVEKKEYGELVKRIDSEKGFEEIFREIHQDVSF